MALVYSPYHRRYVRMRDSSLDNVHRAVAASTPPLAATGKIVSHGFPASAAVDEAKPWQVDIHNQGSTGRIAFGVVNSSGNPGPLKVSWDGRETVVDPGIYYRIYTVDPVPLCSHLATSGAVTFQTVGAYTVRLWGMHEEAGQWFYDEEILAQVTVAAEGAVKQIRILENHKLEVPLLWEGNNVTQPVTVKWDPQRTTITGATLTVRAYSDSDAMQMDFTVNQVKTGSVNWDALQSKQWREAAMEVKTYIANGVNNFKFDYFFTFIPGRGAAAWIYADLLFTYTGEEPEAQPQTPTLWDWLHENRWLLAATGIGVAGVVLITRRREPFIIITPPTPTYSRRREEEEK